MLQSDQVLMNWATGGKSSQFSKLKFLRVAVKELVKEKVAVRMNVLIHTCKMLSTVPGT